MAHIRYTQILYYHIPMNCKMWMYCFSTNLKPTTNLHLHVDFRSVPEECWLNKTHLYIGHSIQT